MQVWHPRVHGNTIDMVTVSGRRVSITHPDRVLYPAGGRDGAGVEAESVTKSQVIDYYRRIAPLLLSHLHTRPVTRKRWPQGVDGKSFFEKNLPAAAPGWLTRCTLVHRTHDAVYPVADSSAALVWFAQKAALELHVPQWRSDAPDPGAGTPGAPDAFLTRRMVFDLDPGPEVGLTDCAEAALAVRELVEESGLACYPVTSGSTGLHVYVALGRRIPSADAEEAARRVAEELARRRPESVTAAMRKTDRHGKVFIDWSQNNGAKTTVTPYSLRGRAEPLVAAPRTWQELSGGSLRQLEFTEVLKRAREHGDLLAGLDGSVQDGAHASRDDQRPDRQALKRGSDGDRLADYKRRRSGETPEPGDGSRSGGERAEPGSGGGRACTFVIQEHHASTLHWDFRLEHDGVLVSWAVPKNLPGDHGRDRIAIHTEDHPLDYAAFSGEIPDGEYGAGTVEIWDRGKYETVKWHEDEILVDLHGRRVTGRYALIATGVGGRGQHSASTRKQQDDNWLIHRVKDQPPAPERPGADGADVAHDAIVDFGTSGDFPRGLEPMLAARGDISTTNPRNWSFEGKWDGQRILVEYDGATLRLRSRNGRDVTSEMPAFGGLADDLNGHTAVLDAELVALVGGVPDFAALQHPDSSTDLRLYVFDVLFLDGRSLLGTAYQDRRRVLEVLAPLLSCAEVPAALDASPREAVRTSRERGLEGVVAKRLDSRYRPGERVEAWIKHKHTASDEVVIGGYTHGNGSRESTFGALLLGVPGSGALQYSGKVGTGFSDEDLEQLSSRMSGLRRKTSPFADRIPRADAPCPQWVRPVLVGEVRHGGRTGTGRFRHPVWRGLRHDKNAADV